jgi:hypothetical protein
MAQRLIALCGYPGAGKDEIAKYLVERHGWYRVSFADPMRRALLAIDPWVKVQEGVFHPLTEIIDEWGWDYAKRAIPEIRTLLQRMGTEAGRDIHGENCWVDLASKLIKNTVGSVVVTDLRFPNELAAVRKLGGTVVHVVRPGVGKVNEHASEQMDYYEASHLAVSNDGDLGDLHRSVELVLAMTGGHES